MKFKQQIWFLIFLFAFVIPGFAHSTGGEQIVNLPATESITGDYYTKGLIVNIAGPVSGDVMAAGSTLDIKSEIGGDVLAAGGAVNSSAKVAGNGRIIGASVDIAGQIGKNLTAAGGNLKLNSETKVLGNAYLIGETIVIDGAISGNLIVLGRYVELLGKTGGSVTVYSKSLFVRKESQIEGNLTYYSENKAKIEDTAVVKGAVTQKPSLSKMKEPLVASSKVSAAFAFTMYKILAFLVIILVAWKIWPERLRRFMDEVNNQFWEKFFWGLFLLIAIPVGAILVIATIVGLPIGLIIIGLYFISLLLSGVLAFLLFGKWLSGLLGVTDQPNSFPWYAFLLGAVVLSVIVYVPVLGALTSFIVWLWALGTFYRSLY